MPFRLCIKERLFSESIAGQMHALLIKIDNSNRIHPVDAAQQSFHSPSIISMCQDFRVSMRDKTITHCGQDRPQLTIVVNLPILKRENATFTAFERLPSSLQIDDRQAAH